MVAEAQHHTLKADERLFSLQAVDELSDILAESANLETSLHSALVYILDMITRPGGAILVQSPGEPAPALLVTKKLPDSLESQLAVSNSALRLILRQVLVTGRPAQPSPELEIAAVIPILARAGQQGVLLISGPACSLSEIAGLLELSRPVSRAIQVGRSNIKILERYMELATIHILAAEHQSSKSFDQILGMMINSVRRVLKGDAVSLILLSENQDGMATKKALGVTSPEVVQEHLKLENSLVVQCIQHRQAIAISDVRKEPIFNPSIDSISGLETRSVLCVPLTVLGNILGVMMVLNKRDGNFDLSDQHILMLMANSIANEIYNNHLMEQLKIANADLEANRWQIQHSRNLLRTLFDSMPASIYIINQKLELVAINRNRTRKENIHPKEVVGERCYRALYAREDPCPDCKVRDTLLSGKATHRLERRWEDDGDHLVQEINTHPIYDDDSDRVSQAILLEQDVTEKSRMETIIAQSEKLAAVGQLAAGLAHEINNPLTAIIANAQMLRRDLPQEEDYQEAVDLIERAGDRAKQVLSNLLDLARQEQYDFTPTDINSSIDKALEMVRHEVMSRSIDLVFDPGEKLPLAMVSQNHIQGVWLNLIINALDALEETKGEIRITTRQDGDNIRIVVADSGKGIPEKQLSQIFDPFFTTKGPGRGTGLGLSICHRIIKQHGGYILVDSKPDMGTKFTIAIPAK
jgi:two-component system NtrC family sensor kinase